LAVPVPPERKASSERRGPKAAPRSESLAQLVGLVKQVCKALSERRGHKAAPGMAWLGPLVLPAKRVRKARSAPRAPKAPLAW
jgi:hypothetical protein